MTTIPELLAESGYVSAHFGKWHIGRANPRVHGYGVNDGANNNGGPNNEQNPNPGQAYATAKLAAEFLRARKAAGEAFFLQVSQYGGRGEAAARAETLAAVRRRVPGASAREQEAAAAAEDADRAMGQVLDVLDELDLTGSTYVFYTTDHGTPGRGNAPLAVGKGTLWDGGLRVPFFVRGPGITAGSRSHERVWGADLLPTVAELAGVAARTPDGGSFAHLLRGEDGEVERESDAFVFHMPQYDSDPLGPTSAIVEDRWKLMHFYDGARTMLFDLAQDRRERWDLAATQPEVAERLLTQLNGYLDEVGAERPMVNPEYDPNRRTETDQRRRGRRGRNRRAP